MQTELKTGYERTWLVLGMHRSGTSLLTHCLVELGGYPGPQEGLMGPASDNVDGFFEPVELASINEGLLALHGTGWIDPPRQGLGPLNNPSLAPLRRRGKAFLEQCGTGHPILLLKDPRLCLTLGFWAELFRSPSAVLSLRSPSAVARSLMVRNGIPEAYSRWLYACYLNNALQTAGERIKAVVFYEDLIADPLAALAPVAPALGFQFLFQDAAVRGKLQSIVRQDLNHAPALDQDSSDRDYTALRKGPKDLASQLSGLRVLLASLLATRTQSITPDFRKQVCAVYRRGNETLASD